MPASERPTKGHEATAAGQGGGDGRRSFWDVLQGSGVSGVLFGANGEARAQFLFGLAVVALLVVAGNISNVLTILKDAPHVGLTAAIVWETSSG